MKILEDLGNNQYKVEILPRDKGQYREDGIRIVHDYIRFDSTIHFNNEDNTLSKISSYEGIQIPIKSFAKIMLPLLNKHEYLQEEHFQDRIQSEDDKYFAKYNLDKPRYLKGDPYPAYSYQNHVVHFYEDGEPKVAVSLNGEKGFSITTLKFFNEFIKDKIKY